jgi:uncharacterized protein YecE (DUF72 family)
MARVWVGTSGFSYKEWKGTFYPPDLPDRGMLPFTLRGFAPSRSIRPSIECLSQKTLEAWRASTPEDFSALL